MPSIRYWNIIRSDQKCQVGEYTVKIGGIQSGKESKGKYVDHKIVFFADRDKVVCHFYNTTQKILVNGHGYKKFIDLFLQPFFNSKIESYLEDIKSYNEFVLDKLGHKTVKRSSVKYNGCSTFDCNKCEYSGLTEK